MGVGEGAASFAFEVKSALGAGTKVASAIVRSCSTGVWVPLCEVSGSSPTRGIEALSSEIILVGRG
jgi:hypothetical protein